MAAKMKTKREWLEKPEESNSWYKIAFDEYDGGAIDLTLADCNRSITWYFGGKRHKGGKRGKAKSAKLLKLAQQVYDYYHEGDA